MRGIGVGTAWLLVGFSALPGPVQGQLGSPAEAVSSRDPTPFSLYSYESAATFPEWQSPRVDVRVLDPVPAFSFSYDPINWRYPVWGAVIGGAAGAVWGTVAMMNSDVEWIAPPAHYFTVPIGIGVGGLLGLLFNAAGQDQDGSRPTSGERGA